MTDALREALQRVGDGVSPVAVPGDVWSRGRRARRRARVSGAAGLVAVVLLVFGGVGLVAGLPGHEVDAGPVAPGNDAGAVPSVIHGVPNRFARDEEASTVWDSALAETDLAIGRGSVAFGAGQAVYLPVVVTAADGAHHLLDLPGWYGGTTAGFSMSGVPLALSPDGTQLAWAWADFSAPESGPVPGGIRIVDLTTGKVRTIKLTGRDGVVVSTVAWSPDSRWLVWQGRMQTEWWVDKADSGSNADVTGRIAPGAKVNSPLHVPTDRSRALAVGNGGDLYATDSGGLQVSGTGNGTIRGDVISFSDTDGSIALPGDGIAGAVSSGGAVALRHSSPAPSVTFVTTEALSDPSGAVSPGPWADLGVFVSRDLPEADYPEGATVEPVGWVDDDHVVALVRGATSVTEDGWTNGESRLVVMSAPWAEGESFQALSTVDAAYEETGGITAMTVAVDLFDPLKTTTRDFPSPEWPWSDERKWLTGLAVVVPLLAMGIFLWTYRRARRPT